MHLDDPLSGAYATGVKASTAAVVTETCVTGMKQGCPISPLLFSLYPDELETLIEEASDETGCPRLAEVLIAILLFADDTALFSYFPKGVQRELGILQAFCAA